VSYQSKARAPQVLVIPNSQDATTQIERKDTTIKAKPNTDTGLPHQKLSSYLIHIEAKLICKQLLLCRWSTIGLGFK